MKKSCFIIFSLFCLGIGIGKAQYTDLIDFTGTSGSFIGDAPWGSLTFSGDTLYGMTSAGGINGYGNIFSIQTNGTNYKDLVDFTGSSGSYMGWAPYGSLIISGDTLYGMTLGGGINGDGNIFSVQTNGTNYKDVVDFTGSSGSYIGKSPGGSLTLSGDILYGMTEIGGVNGDGNIFSVQTNGTNFKDLVDFTGDTGSYIGDWTNGSLTLSGDTLYGMTRWGGINGLGNIFSVQTNGTNFKNLIDFNDTSGPYIGATPFGSLILSGDTLYGMTSEWTVAVGVHLGLGNVFSVQTNGTNFKNLVDFSGDSGSYIGKWPFGSLILSGNTLYGMTSGGLTLDGNIFSVQTNGMNYKDLIDFTGTSSSYIGELPRGSLTLSGNTLYGMTEIGGGNGDGNIFRFNPATTSVNPLSARSEQLKVYPNPNNGIFTISFGHAGLVSSPQRRVEIYNVLGQKVNFETRNPPTGGQGDFTLDISSNPNGVYFYRVVSENEVLLGEGKLVVVH